MNIKKVAKEIRFILKTNFSDIKFSVKCHQFSQGEAVAISWTDGPAKDEVEPLVKAYGDGYSRYIRISRRHSVTSTPEDVANFVETVTIPDAKVQESVILADERLTKLVELQELLILKIEEVDRLRHEIAEMQAKKDEVNYNQRQSKTKKAPMFKIELICTEGAGEKDGTITAFSWDEAAFIIRRWSRAVPINYVVYHLVDIVVYFHDGQSFAFPNFQLKQAYMAKLDLARLIKNKLLFLAGEFQEEYTLERYKQILRRENVDTAKYKRLLDGWEFPS